MSDIKEYFISIFWRSKNYALSTIKILLKIFFSPYPCQTKRSYIYLFLSKIFIGLENLQDIETQKIDMARSKDKREKFISLYRQAKLN